MHMAWIMLPLLLGCSPSHTREESSAKPSSGVTVDALSIVAVPRPNSGTFTTEQATDLLPDFLKRSVSVLTTDSMVQQWKSPTQGIRVHVTADDTVEVVDYFGKTIVGIDSINDALDTTMTDGNERSVLLTSEVPGWSTPVKQQVVAILFQPSVQIYIVENAHG